MVEALKATDEALSKAAEDAFNKAALDYHEKPTPGKLSINITKSTESI